ncbi:restriction endonuclease subunit S [Methylomonas sp. ZR1]|uniref:restriction endonuclease subunit S n=1 Tax=Methylomonas sp. ZR1 TaxID=1797072 RepID=UPI001492A2E0|nr:restriction endonuclease subunit S [Methylomonas sp. ZR1]NOV31895.1 restriction endonuclease subunit S [Methylomonas sp. ZR1]
MKLPESWVETRLGDVLEHVDTKIDPQTSSISSHFYIGLEHIESHTGRLLLEAGDKTEGGDILSIKTQFKAGDILYGKLRPNLNKVYLSEQDGICSTDIWALRSTGAILPEFAAHYLRAPAVHVRASQLATGANLPRVPASSFNRIPIVLPTILEQQRIVDILRLLDDLVTARNTQIAKLHSLIFLLFDEYFQDPEVSRGNEKYGLLADLAWINPPLDSPVDLRQDVSFLPMAAVDEVSGRVTKYETKLFQEVKTGYTRFIENDVLFAKISPCMENGKIAIALGLENGIGAGSTEFHVLRPKPNATAEFLWALTRRTVFRKMAARAFIGTSGHQRVPESFLKTYKLKIPTFEEQLAFSENVRNIFQELDRQENQQILLKESSQALVISAFNGELTKAWRVAHIREITTSAMERKESLFERGSKAAQFYAESKSTPLLQKDLDRPARHWLINELSEFQGAVWTMLRHEWPQKLVIVDDPEAFNDFCTNPQTTGPIEHFNASPNRIRRTLEQLAALGLIAKVSVPRQNAATQQTEYLTAFRSLRDDENSRLRDAAMLKNALNGDGPLAGHLAE